MTYKVKQYINQDRFLREQYSVMKCYEDFSQQKEDFFTKKEQLELFEYFLDQHNKRVLFSFTFWNKFTLTKTPSFLLIHDLIVETVSKNLETLLTQEQWSFDKCFVFLDYVNSLSEVLDQYKVLEYFNFGLERFKMIATDADENDKVRAILDTLVYIIINSKIEITNRIIDDLLSLKDVLKDEFHTLLRSMYTSLIFSTIREKDAYIDMKFEHILLFVFQSKYSRNYLISRIDNVGLLKAILTSTFPESKNEASYDYEEFDKTLLLINRLKELGIEINIILNEYLTHQQKGELFSFLGHRYQHYMDQKTEVNQFGQKTDLDSLKEPLKEYVLELSRDKNFEMTWQNMVHWGLQIFKSVINTEEIYNQCTDSAKNLYTNLVNNENDPLWGIMPQEVKDNVLFYKKVYEKKEQIQELKKEKVLGCIPIFFNKERLDKDIEDIKNYFDKPLITFNDISNYEFDTSSLEPAEYLEKDIKILNPFLMFYLNRMYFFYKQFGRLQENGTININDIFMIFNNGWSEYWGLHLYNYLIHIKKFDYGFSGEQLDLLKEYFVNVQNLNYDTEQKSYVPVYVFYHLQQIFGFNIKLNERTIFKLLQADYTFLKNSQIVDIESHVYPHFPLIGSLIDSSLHFENRDFSNFIKDNKLDIIKVLNELIDTVDMSDSWLWGSASYFHLLSIINFYLLLNEDQKSPYIDKIQSLCIEYFEITFVNASKILFLSPLVLEIIKELGIEYSVLELILKNNTIQECHLEYVTTIQRKYFRTDIWSAYKQIIYDIRIKVNNGIKQVLPYDNIRKDDLIIQEEQQTAIQNLQSQLLGINNRASFKDIVNLKSAVNELEMQIENYVSQNESIYAVKFNLIYLLVFIDQNINIWEEFCKQAKKQEDYNLQDEALSILEYTISTYRISDMKRFVSLLVGYYDRTPEERDYSKNIGISYELKFDFKAILNQCIDFILTTEIQYDDEIYIALQDIKHISSNQLNRIELSIGRVKHTVIRKIDKQYVVGSDKHYFKTKRELITWYLKINNLENSKSTVSQIRPFKYLINDIKKKTFTMSHPYCFEDPIENQYPIDKFLYITCWSFTKDRGNAYAWWKLYGKSQDSFRSVISISDLLYSMISILDTYSNSEIFLGTIEYDLDVSDINYKHETHDQFFKKRKDFEFEKEFRIMIHVDPEDIKDKYITAINNIPMYYSFELKNTNMYKKIERIDTFNEPKFSPYELNLLQKDKNAMLTILKNEINKLQ